MNGQKYLILLSAIVLFTNFLQYQFKILKIESFSSYIVILFSNF